MKRSTPSTFRLANEAAAAHAARKTKRACKSCEAPIPDHFNSYYSTECMFERGQR